MKTLIVVHIKFPFRNSRNVPNKQARQYRGDSRAEAIAELQSAIDADVYSYGVVTRVDVMDADAFKADPLNYKPLKTYKTLEEFVAGEAA